MEIIWGDGARRDFDSAIAYIKAESPSGAKRVGERIIATSALLKDFPEMAPASAKHRELRQFAVSRTSYLVIYRIHAGHIEIRAVVHAKQRRRK
jgi:plasmid stabilization system protein ParE